MPKTSLGKWSVRLILVFFALFILVQIVAVVGRSRGAFDSGSISIYKILIPITIIPAGICGVGAFFTGVISIVRRKERSILAMLSTLIGFLILVFILGEFLFPH